MARLSAVDDVLKRLARESGSDKESATREEGQEEFDPGLAAAEDLIAAVHDGDAQGVLDAMSALVRHAKSDADRPADSYPRGPVAQR
jgi:hypothetical protein